MLLQSFLNYNSLFFINGYRKANELYCVPLLQHTPICVYLHYHRSRKFSFHYMTSNRVSAYNSVYRFPVQFSNNDYLKRTRNSHDTSWTGILDLPFVNHRSVARGCPVTIHHDRISPIKIMMVYEICMTNMTKTAQSENCAQEKESSTKSQYRHSVWPLMTSIPNPLSTLSLQKRFSEHSFSHRLNTKDIHVFR